MFSLVALTRTAMIVSVFCFTHYTLVSDLFSQDSVEFLNGAKMEGTILEIRKEAKEFDFKSSVGGRTLTQTYPYSKVHAVTFNGSRFELTPMAATVVHDSSKKSAEPQRRTKAEVLALIQSTGKTPPQWFDTTPVDYPKSLELDWPLEAKGPWNNQKNVGQFIWDVINPNEKRWQSGIKLVHQCMATHENNRALIKRDADKLATMYFTLLQDYPRAAFWYQQAGAVPTNTAGINLAECYWRLGNREMALELLRGKSLPPSAIKLLGDMGEIGDALRVAAAYRNSQADNEAYLAAGDALRKMGRLEEAIGFYQQVLDSKTARNEDYRKRFEERAAGSIEAIRLFDSARVERVQDGTYSASSPGYNGPVKIEIKVASSRIESVRVTDHTEKQFYAALNDTPKQIIEKQNIREIDGTSGATITSEAIIQASAKALAQGAK